MKKEKSSQREKKCLLHWKPNHLYSALQKCVEQIIFLLLYKRKENEKKNTRTG